jgi:hypothetical protein
MLSGRCPAGTQARRDPRVINQRARTILEQANEFVRNVESSLSTQIELDAQRLERIKALCAEAQEAIDTTLHRLSQ